LEWRSVSYLASLILEHWCDAHHRRTGRYNGALDYVVGASGGGQSILNSPNPSGYDYLQSSPMVAGERAYIGSVDGKVYALDAAAGEVVWTFQTGEKVRATPAMIDGVVYVGSWDKTMVALDAQTGELRWQTPVYGQVQTTALVVNGLVYSASRKASVVALKVESGEKVWEFNYGGNMWVESSPTLLDNVLYIGSSGRSSLWRARPECPVCGTVSMDSVGKGIHRQLAFRSAGNDVCRSCRSDQTTCIANVPAPHTRRFSGRRWGILCTSRFWKRCGAAVKPVILS
jgi:hypothetical protein